MSNYKFETLQLHVGQEQPDPATDARAVLDGPDQVGGAEGVVDDQGQAMLVGNGGDGVNIGDVGVGVAQGFQIDGLGIGQDGSFHLGKVMGVHESSGNTELGKGVGQEVEAANILR